jgi:2-polyprenyl-6-methoxyphenol hydroxylase-like FAD-dependent oxidoreductase
MSEMTDTDVVVAGGGPVGLLLAYELGLAGVRVTVLEREPERPPHARAWGLHARTVETLDRRGLLDGVLDERARWPKMPFAGLWPLLDLTALRSDHPYLANLPQTTLEELLEDRVRGQGTEVRRGHELVGLADDGDGVTATVRAGGGAYRLRGRFLVGCDGGRSTVRGLAGIDFPGTEPTVAAMLCDCSLPTMAEERRGITRTETGTVNINPRPTGVVRVVVTEYHRTHADRDAPVDVDEFRAAVRRVLGRDLAITEPRWLTRFSDATRQADRYRQGRVLLAGDAAHVHFPYGGLGLNLGLQDAVNLAWKLAAAVAGWAPDGLLDTYQAERHPVAAWTLEHSRAQLALFKPDPDVTALRALFADLLGLPDLNRHLAELITGVATRYPLGGEDPHHPAVGGFAPDLRVKTIDGPTGLARLLRTGRGLLLDMTGGSAFIGASAAWSGRIDVVPALPDEPPPYGAVLVRPDGYVAWAAPPGADVTDGRDAAALRTALVTWFGQPVSG